MSIWLVLHAQQKTGKTIVPIPRKGFCPTHLLFHKEDIQTVKKEHPDALVAVHPECTPDVQSMADFVGSTSQICRYVKETSKKKFIVGTEIGIIHRLKRDNLGKEFIPAYEGAVCPNMKLNTLERIYASLKEETHLIRVPKQVAKKARRALEKMLNFHD